MPRIRRRRRAAVNRPRRHWLWRRLGYWLGYWIGRQSGYACRARDWLLRSRRGRFLCRRDSVCLWRHRRGGFLRRRKGAWLRRHRIRPLRSGWIFSWNGCVAARTNRLRFSGVRRCRRLDRLSRRRRSSRRGLCLIAWRTRCRRRGALGLMRRRIGLGHRRISAFALIIVSERLNPNRRTHTGARQTANCKRVRSKYGETVLDGTSWSSGGIQVTRWCPRIRTSLKAPHSPAAPGAYAARGRGTS